MKEINVLDLKERMVVGDIVLIDVREVYELEIAKIDDALHIPINKIQREIEQMNKEKEYAIMCHSGYRSAQVCNYMANAGFKVFNVQGGINSWSLYIDKQIQRY